MSRSELVTIPGHVVGSRRAVDDRALPAEAGQGPAAQGGNAGGSAAEAAPGEGTDVEVRAGELAPLALPVRAFAWSSLPRLSRAAVMVARGLPLSAVDLARALDGVSSDWTHDLGAPVSISCRTVGAAHSDETFAEPGCHALLALGPDRAPACLSLDAGLASAMVERLSGGEGRPSERLAAFGAAECGVLSYLVLRALGRLGSVPLVASLAPRLVSISGAPPTAVLGCQGAITLVLAIDAGFAKGDAVLTLPPRAMTSLAALPRAPFALPPALRPLRAWLAFSVAAARVARAELAALVVGDVVVCERLAVGVSPGDENGAAVHVGALRVLGARSSAAATAHFHAAGWRIAVGPLLVEEASLMTEPTTGELLASDAVVVVTIELGRLSLRFDELAALRSGDTLLLGRSPGAPLDLVAGGQLLARGELVDVDGELGLRILSLR